MSWDQARALLGEHEGILRLKPDYLDMMMKAKEAAQSQQQSGAQAGQQVKVEPGREEREERTTERTEEAPAAEHKAEARRLRASGWSIGEIADRLGRSKATIHAWVKDVQVPRRARELPSFRERSSPVERDQDVLSLKRQIAILELKQKLRGLEKRERLESIVEQSQGQLTTAYLLADDQLVYNGRLYDLADARGRENLKAAATAPAALAALGIGAPPGSITFYSIYLVHRGPQGKLLRAYDVTLMRWLSPSEYKQEEFLFRAVRRRAPG